MRSPVSIPFQSFIKIDRGHRDAVYLQIVYQLIQAVKSHLLENNDQLPGSRLIAENLQVHRKTVVAALAELQEQGWVETVPNVGTFVRNPEQSSPSTAKTYAFQHPPEKAPFYFRREFILDTASERNEGGLYFSDGTPDERMIPPEELARFYTSVVRRKKQSVSGDNRNRGRVFFRDQLSSYLNVTRGFHLSRDYLLPVSGPEKVHSVLSHLLIQKGDVILVEDLSYFLPNMIYSQAGAQLQTVPTDEDGMVVEYIQTHFRPGEIRFVYVNSRCQYPTTVMLSEERKAKLLLLAEAYDFLVVEEDRDFEFSVHKKKKDTLLHKKGGHRVVYIGSFGGFLNQGFRMNFLIAPKDFVEEGAKYLNILGKPDAVMEKALGELIHQGDIHRYQRKALKVIAERKAQFAHLLQTFFQNQISFRIPASGLAFWIVFKGAVPLTRLQKKAQEKGLFIPLLCLYQNRNVTALRLGFAHLTLAEMEAAVKVLAATYGEMVSERLVERE